MRLRFSASVAVGNQLSFSPGVWHQVGHEREGTDTQRGEVTCSGSQSQWVLATEHSPRPLTFPFLPPSPTVFLPFRTCFSHSPSRDEFIRKSTNNLFTQNCKAHDHKGMNLWTWGFRPNRPQESGNYVHMFI